MNRTVSPYKAWAKAQSKTSDHRIAVVLYAIICGFALVKPSFAFWGPFIFFIITALMKMGDIIASMLVALIITTVASLINPILGFIVSILFFFMKLSNFIRNWRALLAGIFIYILPALLTEQLGYYLYYSISSNKLLHQLDVSYLTLEYITLFITGGLAGLILHLILNWLYRHQYSAKSALSTMGATPLIILLLILPFIINAVVDLIDDVMSTSGSIADDFMSFKNEFDSIDLDGDGINDHIHHVKGHYRSTPDGGVTYVDPHIRTNPNSIVSDNISYHK